MRREDHARSCREPGLDEDDPTTTSLDLAAWLPDASTLQRSAALSRALATQRAHRYDDVVSQSRLPV